MKKTMIEAGRIMREAWDENPKEFIGECLGGLAAVGIVPAMLILAAVIAG